MQAIWSDEGKLARWLEVELAALDGWAEVGVVPAEDVAQIRASAVAPTPERVLEIEERTQHDLAAFVDASPSGLGPEGRWLHYGLTSSDVLDTALALQVRDAGALLARGDRPRARGRGAPGRGAPRDRLLGPHARRTRRADHVRREARRLGVRARPRPRAAEPRARRHARRQALGRGRHLRRRRPRGRARRLRAPRTRAEPVSTQVVPRDRHAELLSALALVAASLERFATEIRHLARTEVREVQEPFAQRPEGLVGDAAQAEPDRRRADLRARARRARRARSSGSRTWRSGTSATSRTRAPSGSCSRRVPRARLHARPLRLARRRPGRRSGADAAQPRRVARARLQPARAARARRVGPRARRGLPARAAQRHCGPGTRSATSARSSRPTRRSPGGSARRRSRPRSTSATPCATSTSSSSASPRSRDREGDCRCLRPRIHVASGKVRELYELDDDRLLLVASDRISTFDVVLPTEIPDKGRVLTGLSAFWFARTQRHRARTTCSALRADGRSTEVPAPRDAADRVRRARLPRRLRLEGLPRDRRDVAATALPEGLQRVGPAARADLHAGDEGAGRATTRTSAATQAAELVGAERSPRSSASALALYRFAVGARRGARDHPRRHEVRARPRRATAGSCSATRR